MKNVILSALVVFATILTGCNKGGSTSACRVKAMISGKGQTTEFFYTPENKVSSIKVYGGAPDTTKVTFTYAGNTVTQSVTNPQSPEPRVQVLHLSAAGYVDSFTVSNPMGNILTVNTHDADGHTTLTQEYLGGQLKRTTQFTFKDGNEVSRVISDETMKPMATVYFDYFTDKSNSLTTENQGMKFRGTDSKNLMKKAVQVTAKGDSMGVTFSYRFDDKGRVISQATYQKEIQADSNNITYY
jgi:hypothetical protein